MTIPPATPFRDYLARLTAHEQSIRPVLPTWAGTFSRLVNEHVPNLRVTEAPLPTRPADAGGKPCAYRDDAVAVFGSGVAPDHLGDAVTAAHGLRSALLGESSSVLAPAVLAPDEADTHTESERRALSVEQLMQRRALVASFILPLDTPPSPEVLAWSASVLEIWAYESPHPLDMATDPAGWAIAQSDRASRAQMLAEMARSAARDWERGAKGVDAEDAPAVAWIGLRSFTLQLIADDLEYHALSVLFPNAR